MTELKVLIKPILDRTSTSRMKDQLSKSTTVTGKRSVVSQSGGNSLGDSGNNAKNKSVIGLLGKASIGIALIAIGIKKVVGRLAESSPMLAGVLQQLKNATNLFFLPFGNMLAMKLLPLAKDLMKFAMEFNQRVKNGDKDPLNMGGGWDSSKSLVENQARMRNEAMGIKEGDFDKLDAYVNKISKPGSDPVGTILGDIGNAITGLFATKPVVISPQDGYNIVPRMRKGLSDLQQTVSSSITEAITVNINAPVYGVNDLEKAITSSVSKLSSRRNFA